MGKDRDGDVNDECYSSNSGNSSNIKRSKQAFNSISGSNAKTKNGRPRRGTGYAFPNRGRETEETSLEPRVRVPVHRRASVQLDALVVEMRVQLHPVRRVRIHERDREDHSHLQHVDLRDDRAIRGATGNPVARGGARLAVHVPGTRNRRHRRDRARRRLEKGGSRRDQREPRSGLRTRLGGEETPRAAHPVSDVRAQPIGLRATERQDA